MKTTAYALDGLQTDPGPFSGAPDGALVDAHNVVIERVGLIEPRGPLECVVDATLKAGGYVLQHAIQTPIHSRTGWAVTGGGAWIMRANEVTTITGPSSFTKGRLHSAVMRSRLLFTSENGVCEWPPDVGLLTVAYRAGLMRPSMPWGYVVTGGSAGTWLATAQSVAYRFVLVRKRADGTLMQSAPTAPFIVRNTSGASGGVEFIAAPGLAYTPYDVNSTFDALQTGDQLRVYRSPVLNAATGTPSDVMRLRATLTITAGALQSFQDKLADADWNGPPLYTNTTQEGILQARDRPGYSRDVCSFNGMALYAGFKRPQRVAVTCKAIGDISADPQQALCTKTVTVTTGVGSLNLTGISAADIKYLAVGQYITLTTTNPPGGADARFQAATQIASVNVGAGTATINKTALAGGAASVVVWDWISVTDNATTYIQYAEEATNTTINELMWRQAHGASGVYMGGYADLEFKWNNASTRVKDVLLHAVGSDEVNGKPEFRNVLMTFERASMSATTFVIRSSKPNAFDAVVDSVTGITSTQDGSDARIGVSVNDIPDAVPELNYLDVGDLTSPIYRIVPTRSCVFVIKGDGVFMLYGTSKDTLSVQQLDATVRPPPADIAANWITSRGDTVYMMSARGPVAITESGVTPFGTAILETLRETFYPAFIRATGFTSCAAGAAPATPYVFFSYEDADDANVYAYNTQTNAWSTWGARRRVSTMYSSIFDLQYFGMQYVHGAYFDKRSSMGAAITASSVPLTGDYFTALTCTINTVTPNGTNRYTIEIAAGSEWTPTVGDTLIRAGVLCVVESVASATTFDVVSNGTPVAGAGATWEEGYPIRLTWAARALGTIEYEKRNAGFTLAFALRALLLRLTAYYQSAYAPGGVQTVEQPAITGAWDGASTALLAAPEVIPLSIPRNVVLDWGLRVGFAIQQARSWFSLGAITLVTENSGANVGRGRG